MPKSIARTRSRVHRRQHVEVFRAGEESGALCRGREARRPRYVVGAVRIVRDLHVQRCVGNADGLFRLHERGEEIVVIHADESERAFGNRLRGDLVGCDTRDVAVLEEDRLDRRAVGGVRRLRRDAAAQRRTPAHRRRHRLVVARHRRGDVDDIRLVRGDRERLLGAHAGGASIVECACQPRLPSPDSDGHDEGSGGEHRGQRRIVDGRATGERCVRRRMAGDDLVGTTAAVAVFLQLPALDRGAARREHRAHVAVLDDELRERARRAALRWTLEPTVRGWPGLARRHWARCRLARLSRLVGRALAAAAETSPDSRTAPGTTRAPR